MYSEWAPPLLFETMTHPPLAYSEDITQFCSASQQNPSTNIAARKKIGSDIVLISMICTLLKPPMSGIVDYNTST